MQNVHDGVSGFPYQVAHVVYEMFNNNVTSPCSTVDIPHVDLWRVGETLLQSVLKLAVSLQSAADANGR